MDTLRCSLLYADFFIGRIQFGFLDVIQDGWKDFALQRLIDLFMPAQTRFFKLDHSSGLICFLVANHEEMGCHLPIVSGRNDFFYAS